MSKQSLRERVARRICEWRNVDPDALIEIGQPPKRKVLHKGTPHEREILTQQEPIRPDVAWKGYAGIADKIIKEVKKD